MTWTVAEDENAAIHVRAIIDADRKDELRELIVALQKRLTEEPSDGKSS